MIKRGKNIQEGLDTFAQKHFGITQGKAEAIRICMFCKQEVKGFKDYLSKQEYSVSGMCQACQDKFEEECEEQYESVEEE